MKKTVWLFSFLLIALSFGATAQVVSNPAAIKSFKPLNGDPLDAIRQRYTQQAGRMANTEILVDYASSSNDNALLNASFMNMHFAPADTFGDRYVVVTYDTLHDDVSNTGYQYSDFDSVRVDTVYFGLGHENNDGLSDTVIIKLVSLNASGYPTNTTLWADTITSGPTSFTGQAQWLMFAPVFVAPQITLPSTTKFGFRVEYYGAKTDTFGYIYSFFNLGTCPNVGLSYRAAFSDFWPNSYRHNVFNNLLLPTATGQDIAFDCDGNTSLETIQAIQNINYVAKLTGIEAALPPGPKVRLLRVDPVNDEVTIKNFGDAAQNISTYTLCSNLSYTSNLTSQTLMAGALNLAPGDTVKLGLTTLNLDETGSDLGLYMNSFDFSNQANMVDFTQWLSGGNGRESVAVAKGIWGAGDFVADGEPYSYVGDGYQDGVTYWRGTPPPGCDTITNVLVTDTLSLFSTGGDAYVSGHNEFGDRSKADKYDNSTTAQVTGAFLFFAVAKFSNTSKTINVNVWDSDGNAGEPGTLLTSQAVTIASIAPSVTNNVPFEVTFTNPAQVDDDFYVGITFEYASGDTVALITSHDRTPNTAWEEWSDSTWHSYPSAWNLNAAHFIFPVLCVGGNPCPTINIATSATNAICTSVNGTATATATGGAAPYMYQWNAAAGNQTTATATGLAAGTYTVIVTDDNGCTATASVTVGVTNTTLNLLVTDTDNTACVNPNGTATVVATGGTAPYIYGWNPSGSTATITDLAAGTYSVTVYDANGCEGTGSTTVGSAPPVITITTTASTPNTQCINPNGTATVSATGGTMPYIYQWNAAAGSQTGPTASNLAGGNYSVVATDGAGCTGTGNVTVGTTTPTITVSVTSNTPSTSCSAPDGTATVDATGGAGSYTYQWDAAAGNQTGPTASNLAGGTYNVVATDGSGCTGNVNVTISSTTPVINVTVANATGNTSCSNPNGAATVSANGGTGPYIFTWSSSQTGDTQTGLTHGTYTVTATDINNCQGTGSVTIIDNRPAIAASVATSPVTSCVNANGSATATVTNASGTVTYTWSTSPAQTGSTATDLAAGNYTVTALDQPSGCTVSASGTVGTNTPAVSVTISASANVTNCDTPNGSATATGSGGAGGFTYAWSTTPQQTTPTATGLAAGTYTVTATSSNGCTASTTASISNNTATVTVDITTTAVSSCSTPNGAAVAVATGGATPYSYLWSNGATSSTLNGLSAGTYSVTVEDANGCEGSDNAAVGTTINAPSVSVSATDETASGDDGTATAAGSGGNAPYSYAWNNSETTETITGLDAGIYTVTITDAQGCTASASDTVKAFTSIALPAGVDALSIFPNPTTDVVTIQMELQEAKNVRIEWFNVLGESVIVREFTKVNTVSEQFSLHVLPEGIYMTRITVGADAVTSRITLVH